MPDRTKMGTADVIRADARRLPIADDSVDLVVTSPPYFALRSYRDGGEHYAGQIGDEPTPAEFVDSLLEVTRECVRVLKPTGSLWVNLGDKYAVRWASIRDEGRAGLGGPSAGRRRAGANRTGAPEKSLIGIPWRYALRCIDDLGLILRAETIWSKPNGLPESVTDRVRRSHETWFHFTLRPRYFAAMDELRVPHTSGAYGRTRNARTDRRADEAQRFVSGTTRGLPPQPGDAGAFNPLGRLPGSVWSIATEPLSVPEHLGIDHFAAFPTEWPKRIIQGWAPEGGTVLDPFGGTGTTAMVAKALGCHGISVDMSSDYCRLAEWRIDDRDQLAKVRGLSKVEKQPIEQGDLFDLLGS